MIFFLKLIRYKNLLLILLTMILTKYALVQSFVHQSYFSNFQFTILCLSVIFIAAGGYIINDIFDVEADKINKPNRIFIGTTISNKNGWLLYYLISFLGIILGIYLSFNVKLPFYSSIFIFSYLGLFLYSYYLKKIMVIGNLITSIFCALPIIVIFLFENPIYPAKITDDILVFYYIIVYSSFAFLTTLIREIIKDIEDVDGDLQLKAKTLPIVLGRERAKNIAVVISLILLISLIQISTNFLYPKPLLLGYTFIFILLPLAYFTYQLWNANSKKEFHILSNFMKLIMLLGILSMLFFRLN